MSDDSLDEMPEFGPDERIPIVVPDQSGPIEFDPSTPLPLVPTGHLCKGIEPDGKRCDNYLDLSREYCFKHDPRPDELLQMFSERLQSFVQNCRSCGGATAGEIMVLSKAIPAFAVLWDRKAPLRDKEELVKKVRFVKVS